MLIALAQLNYHIGNFENNTSKIIKAIAEAKDKKVDLIVFAELSVCGYPPRDFLEFSDFILKCNQSINQIASHCQGIAAIVGAPSVNPKKEGKDLFNTAYFLSEGKVFSWANKTLLPTYDVFDEYRYFEPNVTFNCIEYKGRKIALTICEDLWNINDNPLYVQCPMDRLMEQKPDLMINIAASPFDYLQQEKRKKVLHDNAVKYGLDLLYVNQVGAQTELIFDGGSLAYNKNGELIAEAKYFDEELLIIDTTLENKPLKHEAVIQTERIFSALVLGIREYFSKMGFKKAILGLSGGVDSALVMVLAAKALGAENVRGVLLPSKYSSNHSINDARQLAENLGCPYDIISIEEAVSAFGNTLSHFFAGLPENVTEENIQARCRAVILMALSNKFGYILLNTTNKSEAAVGYGTLYGDMCGGLAVLGDVYKTQVYDLCHLINKELEVIPTNIITKAPSAELKPNQKDSDSLPDYFLLDQILHRYIEQRQGPDDLLNAGFEPNLVKRVLKMVNSSEWKRHQTPPILRISPKAFGSGRRMPIVGKYLS